MSEEQNIADVDLETSNTVPESTEAPLETGPISDTRKAIEEAQKEIAAKASETTPPIQEAPKAKKQKSGAAPSLTPDSPPITKSVATTAPDLNLQNLPKEQIAEPKESETSDNRPPIPAPQFWEAPDRAAFDKLSYEAKELIAKNEHRTRTWASSIAQEVAETRRFHKDLEGVFAPHENLLKLNKTEPLTAIDNLLTNAALMEENPIMMLTRYMRQYGLTPQHFINGGGQMSPEQWNGYQPQEEYQDPRAEEALNGVKAIQERLERQSQELEAQKQRALQAEIESFRGETDTNGNPLRPYFDFYRPQLGAVVEKLEAEKPWLSPRQILNEAYTKVIGEVEEKFVKPRLPNGQFASTDQKVVTQSRKAEAAAGSLSGSSLGNSVARKISKTSDAITEARRELGML